MVATINLTNANPDLVGYFNNWTTNFGYNGNGAFSPNNSAATQWAAGEVNGTTNTGVILNGNFSYAGPNGFGGTVNNLKFGTDLNGSAASGYSVGNDGLTVQFGDAPNAAFSGAIYSLSHGGSFTGVVEPRSGQLQAGFYDYFGEVGTVQVGSSAANRLYSFDGNDTLTGGNGRDRFVFDRDIDGALSTSIGNDTITDFTAGANGDYLRFALQDTAFDTFAEVYAAADQVGANTVIDLGTLGTITLNNVTKTNLVAGNFEFVA